MTIAPSPRLGVTLGDDGASFRVWAPHAQSACLELRNGTVLPLSRDSDTWAAAFAPGLLSLQSAPLHVMLPCTRLDAARMGHAGVLQKGTQYRVMLVGEEGQELERRDPYARQTDYDSAWCTVDDARGAPSSHWRAPPFDEYLIYEVCVHA